MAHSQSRWNPPQYTPSGNVPANDDSTRSVYRPRPGSGQEVGLGDHHQVVVFTSFRDQALSVMHASGGTGNTPAAINNGQSGTETHWHFPASQQLEYPQSETGTRYVPDQNQFQQLEPLHHSLTSVSGLPPANSDFNQYTTINPSQTFLYPLTPNSEPQTHEQYFHGGSADQPALPQGESEFPPIYLTSADTLPGMQTHAGGSLLLVPPSYNYAANHPSSAKSGLLESLLEKGANRLAYIYMDASSAMWIQACNNTIGKDGPTEKLMRRIVEDSGFRQMQKSPHLQDETCIITVRVPASGQRTAGRGRKFIEIEVTADVDDVDFMRAFRDELRSIPDRVYEHLWKCSRLLLQPSARRRGIFANEPGSLIPIDPRTLAKLQWAFEMNEEWGFGIFHEIIEDGDSFRPGRWFCNTDFYDMLQEGMFDISSPGWMGFIDATADTNSSWRMAELPTVHVFAFAISWIVVTARYDFMRMRSVASSWVSNARIEDAKTYSKFLEPWLLKYWKLRKIGGGADAQIQSGRSEGVGFMLRFRSNPLQAI